MSDKNIIDPETNLTTRQRNLLFAIIKEYCEFGTSVGSKELKDKYGFDFSPATIRSEMARLRDNGYLYQPFTNASSQPTEIAFKLFINQLIVGLQVTSRQQQELKKQIFEMEEKQANLHKEISRLLAFQTGAVGFSVNEHRENVTGIGNLLTSPNDGKVSEIINFLDNLDTHKKYLLENSAHQMALPGSGISSEQSRELTTIFGSESAVLPLGQGYAMVATEVYLDDEKTVIGLITPVHVLARKKNLELVQTISKVLGKKSKE
jgi:transcriptional regulator of heat shock response